jgi:hypothetical protein
MGRSGEDQDKKADYYRPFFDENRRPGEACARGAPLLEVPLHTIHALLRGFRGQQLGEYGAQQLCPSRHRKWISGNRMPQERDERDSVGIVQINIDHLQRNQSRACGVL